MVYLTKNILKRNPGTSEDQAKDHALILLKKHQDNLFGKNSLSATLAYDSFEYFCLYYLQDFFVPKENNIVTDLSPVHYEIWQLLEQMLLQNTHNKQAFILPRGMGKTTIVNIAVTAWMHVFKRSVFTIILGARELDAAKFVATTKKALTNDYIKNSFGDFEDTLHKRTDNKLEFELTNDTKIMAFSANSSVRGTQYVTGEMIFRPTLVVADDYISEADILSSESKNKKYLRWQKEIEDVGSDAVYRNGKLIRPSTKFIVIGTPLSQGDFIDSISNDPTYKTFHRSVVNFDVDEYFENHKYWQKFKTILFDSSLEDSLFEAKSFYQDNKKEMDFPTIWEKYEIVELAIGYFNKPVAFKQEKMCDVKSVGDKWFKSNRVEPMQEIESHEFTKTMLTVDPAGVKNVSNKRSDYFAFTLGSIADNGFKYIRKATIDKITDFDKYIHTVISTLHGYPDITHVYVEKNTYNGLDVERMQNEINQDQSLRKRNITFINEMQRKNKDEKISTIVSDVNNGRVIFCEDRVSKEYLNQVMEFSGQNFSLHDDAADSLAECCNRLDEIEEKNKKLKTIDRRILGI